MMIINGTYLRNYGSMLLLQQMYTLYNLIPGHNTLSQNTYQNTFLVYTYSAQCTLYSIQYTPYYSVYHAYCILYNVGTGGYSGHFFRKWYGAFI